MNPHQIAAKSHLKHALNLAIIIVRGDTRLTWPQLHQTPPTSTSHFETTTTTTKMIPNVLRIPTAAGKNPVTELSQLLSVFAGAVDRQDWPRSLELVRKMRGLCMESERSRRGIATAGVLAGAFDELSSSTPSSSTSPAVIHELQEEILLFLASILPLSAEARASLGSSPSVTSLVRMLNSSDLGVQRNAVFVVKELALTSDQARAAADLPQQEGLIDGLVKVLKEPICPSTTKAALVAIFYLISSSKEETAAMLTKTGLLPSILDLLVGSDHERKVCERAIGVMDAICSSEQGREVASDHALTVPLLVKKIFRVSDLATEFAVSALWKLLCKNGRGDEAGEVLCMECLQVGAFQKALLLLQVECGEKTREKATQLLKLLNMYRSKGECIETMDFKQLKRSF